MKRIPSGLSVLRSPWFTYGVAVLLTAAALALTQQSSLHRGSPFLLFLAAIILSSRYGGLGPGLVAGLLAVAATTFFFLPPIGSFLIESSDDIFRLGVFAFIALMLTWLTATREQVKDLARMQAKRQATLAELGQCALTSHDRSALLEEAAALLNHAFDVEHVGIFEALPDSQSLLLKAGRGWHAGLVGRVLIAVDADSFVGSALLSQDPVILRDLRRDPTGVQPRPQEGLHLPRRAVPGKSRRWGSRREDAALHRHEKRLNVPRLLNDHNVISGVNVVVPAIAGTGPAQPFGVVGVYTTERRDFTKDDVDFLQAFANTLAYAIERVQTETQVAAQREWLRMTLSSIGDGVMAADPHGVVTFMNSAAQSLTGWSEAEAVSRPLEQVFQVVDEKTGQSIENPVAQVIRTREVVQSGNLRADPSPSSGQATGHVMLVTRTGRRIPIDDSAAPMCDDQGQLVGVVFIFRDISVRWQNEEAIRQSEERFRIALKNSPVAVFHQDTERRYTWVYNPARGFPPPSAVGQTDVDLMSSAEAARWTEIKDGVVQSGIGTREELTATVHGERRTFDLTVEPLRDGEGNIAGITCTSIDITERKREQATTARLAAIVESSEDAIIGKTLDGVILSWNPGAERLYGYAPDEIIGQSVSVLYPPDRQDEFRAITERLKQGEPVEHHDTVRVRKDSKPIDVSVNMSLVRDSMGRIVGASAIERDVTQRKRTEDLQRFRVEVSELLSSSLEYEKTLTGIARLSVPRIADWCAVHLLAEDGTIRQVALAHADPAKVERAQELLARYPLDPNASVGVPSVIRTGQPEFVEQVSDEQLAAMARAVSHLQFLVDGGLKSYMVVPLTVRRRTFGALSFASAESGHHLTPDDLALAQDLANRAALWGDNARLFQELQKTNEELEQRVVRRTTELQAANQQLHEEIAERRRTTEQLRQLSVHLQSAREEERMSVAREIHDELGQILTAVRMDLDLLERDLFQSDKPSGTEEVPAGLHATRQLVDDSIQKMHQIIRELRPEMLDHLGLRAAIEWQAQEFQTRSGIECQFTAAVEVLPLDRDRSTAIFRILQEALTNVARHARATRVEIGLRKEDGQVVLHVRDNGRGITEGEISDPKSFGILGMRERALVFGGHVDLRSTPGQGTIVVAHIPMEGLHDSNPDRR